MEEQIETWKDLMVEFQKAAHRVIKEDMKLLKELAKK